LQRRHKIGRNILQALPSVARRPPIERCQFSAPAAASCADEPVLFRHLLLLVGVQELGAIEGQWIPAYPSRKAAAGILRSARIVLLHLAQFCRHQRSCLGRGRPGENREGMAGRGFQALGAIKDTRAIEPLIQVLKDNNGSVRANAAVALGKINDTRAAGPLIQALKASDSHVRRGATWAL